MKKKGIMLILILLVLFISYSCKTTNEIYNKAYDVDINIDNISEALIPAAEKGSQAVVGVSLYSKSNILRSWYIASTGSGVVYKGMVYYKDGTSSDDLKLSEERNDIKFYEYYLLTNAHVVNSSNEYSEVKVYLSNIDTIVDGVTLGMNVYEDLAVVKFTTSIYIDPIEISNEELKVGEIVLAIGNPLGYEYANTVTMGIISNLNRYIDVKRDTNGDGKNDWEGTCRCIQHDASINSGSSGGALINSKGKLVGLNAMKVMDDKETVEGIGFAIPTESILNCLEKMENGNKVTINEFKDATLYNVNKLINKELFSDEKIPDVDISLCNYTYGVYIYNMKNEEFGLQKDDIIVKLNDIDIYNIEMFLPLLRYYNEKITWTVIRDGNEITVDYLFE